MRPILELYIKLKSIFDAMGTRNNRPEWFRTCLKASVLATVFFILEPYRQKITFFYKTSNFFLKNIEMCPDGIWGMWRNIF